MELVPFTCFFFECGETQPSDTFSHSKRRASVDNIDARSMSVTAIADGQRIYFVLRPYNTALTMVTAILVHRRR